MTTQSDLKSRLLAHSRGNQGEFEGRAVRWLHRVVHVVVPAVPGFLAGKALDDLGEAASNPWWA
jgi:hypothetical protein